MNKSFLISAACLVGVAACGTHVPTNAELTTLLHREGAPEGNPKMALDRMAVMCLRTWSGDSALTADLPPTALLDAAKGQCRSRLDGWLADSARNPAKLDFAQISSPEAVRRAMDLLGLRAGGKELAETSNPAMPRAAPAPVSAPVPAPDLNMVMSTSADLCQQAKDLYAKNPQDMRLYRFSDFCEKHLSETRSEIDRLTTEGNSPRLEQIARSTDRMNKMGERLIANHQKQ